MLNCLLFVLFFVISYLLVDYFYINRQVNKFQKRNIINNFSKDNFFKKLLSKINFIKTKENYLFLQGYPLNLNAISYYVLKLLLALFFGVVAFINYNSVLLAVLFFVVGFLIIDVYVKLNKKNRDLEICNDLMNVTTSLMMQLSSFVPLKYALKNQYENCHNKDFRKAIMMFSTKYELSELNIEDAINDLNSRFDIVELDMFCNTIRQYNKVGNIINLLDNLSTVLKDKFMSNLKNKTREKIIYITLGVAISLGNMIMLIFYPLFISIGNNLNQIFR